MSCPNKFFLHWQYIHADLTTGEIPSETEAVDNADLQEESKRWGLKLQDSVSHMCGMSKLLEHVICSQVRCHLNEHGISAWFQHGFRAEGSCETQLAITMRDLHKPVDEGTLADMGILDLSKFFGIVPHTRLLPDH